MFEFLKKLLREEAPAPVQEPVQEPKPEAPKVLTDDEKLIIKAVKKSHRFEVGSQPKQHILDIGQYSLDDGITIQEKCASCSLLMEGQCIAYTNNEYGLEMIYEAISERFKQNREEKRNKLNAMLGD